MGSITQREFGLSEIEAAWRRTGSKYEDGRRLIESEKFLSAEPRVATDIALPGYVVQYTPTWTASNLELSGWHFRACEIQELRIAAGAFTDCVVEGCVFTGLRTWSIRLERVRILNSSLREVNVAPLDPKQTGASSQFRQCSLERCDLSSAGLLRAQFVDSRFSGCKLRKASFRACHFRNCSWSGKLVQTEIYGGYDLGESVFDSCDLSGLILDWADLRFTTLRHCTLPGAPDHVSVQNGFADRLEDARCRLRASDEPWSQGLLCYLSGNDGAMDVQHDQQAGVLALKDVREIGGDAAEALVRSVFTPTE